MAIILTPSGVPHQSIVTALPAALTANVTKLAAQDHRTLIKKREWLQEYSVYSPPGIARRILDPVLDAALVFAQHEAGTAICISAQGLLLTCSHCVAESDKDLEWNKTHWLLFASGQVVAAKTVAWDARRDLALLQIVRASASTTRASSPFPCLNISPRAPAPNARLLCVGHPGSDDLETIGEKTNYDTLVLSTGKFYGLAAGQDPQDNSEIGALMHDCWTYWGHSGAPLVDRKSGLMIGMHSSWDDETGMRRGIALEAVRAFTEDCERLLPSLFPVVID